MQDCKLDVTIARMANDDTTLRLHQSESRHQLVEECVREYSSDDLSTPWYSWWCIGHYLPFQSVTYVTILL